MRPTLSLREPPDAPRVKEAKQIVASALGVPDPALVPWAMRIAEERDAWAERQTEGPLMARRMKACAHHLLPKKSSAAAAAEAKAESGLDTPLDYMLRVMRDPKVDPARWGRDGEDRAALLACETGRGCVHRQRGRADRNLRSLASRYRAAGRLHPYARRTE
jgi:hypothetical protein